MTTIHTNESNTTVETNPAPKPDAKDDGIVGTVLELGFAWAAYGLKIGTSALEHGAKTLEVTAKALDRLSTELAQKSRVQAETADAAK